MFRYSLLSPLVGSASLWALLILLSCSHPSAVDGQYHAKGHVGHVQFRNCSWSTTEWPAQCANITVPLYWGDVDKNLTSYPTIQVHVTRVAGRPAPGASTVSRQLWFLTGGPSHTPASAFQGPNSFAASMANTLPHYDFYLPEVRGLAWSTPVTCPGGAAVPSLSNGCPQALNQSPYKERLQGYTLTNAARDVAYVMQQVVKGHVTRYGSKPTLYGYGVSFGTAWLNRLGLVLPLYKVAFKSVVFDSYFPPGLGEMQTADVTLGDAGKELFTVAGRQNATAQIFQQEVGKSPWALLQDTFTYWEQGNSSTQGNGTSKADSRVPMCLQDKLGVTNNPAGSLKAALGANLFSYYQRPIALALMLRLARCSAQDVEVIKRVLPYFVPYNPNGSWPSDVLQGNMFLGPDMYSQSNPVYNKEELLKFQSASYFSDMGTYALQMYRVWPQYGADQFANAFAAWPEQGTGAIILQGTLDANTPYKWAKEVSATVGTPLYTFPLVPHVVIDNTPTTPNPTVPGGSPVLCGWAMVATFFSTGQVNSSCLDQLVHHPLDLSGNTEPKIQALSASVFGTPDLYGVLTPIPSPSPSSDPDGPPVPDDDGGLPTFYVVTLVLGGVLFVAIAAGFFYRRHLKSKDGHTGAEDGAAVTLADPAAASPYEPLADDHA